MRLKAIYILVFVFSIVKGQNIYRFEHFNSKNGLAQNTVLSIYCDTKGFLWIGTWNGLNRYDGKEFKIYRSQGTSGNVFTSNRIRDIWEDKKGFIWMKTYDGYYHYFNPRKEVFETLPDYTGFIEERNSVASCFFQENSDRIWIGTTRTGAYSLTYVPELDEYKRQRFLSRGTKTLSNNTVRFINADSNGDVWIGTHIGLNKLTTNGKISEEEFSHQFADVNFTSAVCETPEEMLFGTKSKGILGYNKNTKKFRFIEIEDHIPEHSAINHIVHTKGKTFVSVAGKGIFVLQSNKWQQLNCHDRNIVGIYTDKYDQLWLTGNEYGLTRIDAQTLSTYFYQLTTPENRSIIDLERHYFFEDNNNQLWIGLHGGGLAQYMRHDNTFKFYKNDAKDTKSLSSNVVLCVTQDRSGQLWLGTGLYSGGLEKAVMQNLAFEQIMPLKEANGIIDNVTRALFEDVNGVMWVATKSGKIFLYRPQEKSPFMTKNLEIGSGIKQRSNNVYTITQDHLGYIWLGSKGEGVARSNAPITTGTNYQNLQFNWHIPIVNDTSTYANRNVYSIVEDKSQRLWIGTFGGGIFVTDLTSQNQPYKQISSSNSNLSSDQIRQIWIDDQENVWVATTFGVNFLSRQNIDQNKYEFKTLLHSPDSANSLSYNDVISIFEDSKKRLWFSTFGGGVNVMANRELDNPKIKTYTTNEGLCNDVVFASLEDKNGLIWLSTENGLTRLDPETGITEIFDENNGLGFSNFSENTAIAKRNGQLAFGGNMGFVTIDPARLRDSNFESQLEFTNFFVSNKKVEASQPNSPLTQSIDHTELVELKHHQSGFSIDFAALDFQNPYQTQYAFKLSGLDNEWVYPGNNSRATYTNLKPGQYKFEVRWTNRDGQWNKQTKTLQINILHPWYATWWSYLGYALIFGVLIFFIAKTMLKLNNYKHNLLLEKKINLLKLQFFTNVSHEIRTPLTMIIGPIEDLLLSREVPQKIADQLKMIKKNANRMLLLTNQLLDFRKVQNNKMVLNVREVDIVAFAKDIFQSFQPLAQHKHIDYQFQSNIESFNVWIDISKIDIVIYNLLSNALKFTDPGKRVLVKLSGNGAAPMVHLTVHDEGRGIPMANLDDLFTRYTILSNNELSGTGIGLSLSYELAKLHGGDIKVESQLNTGSSFSLHICKGKAHFEGNPQVNILNQLPADFTKHQPDDDLSIEESETELSPTNNINETILIVEDNHEILNYIANSLQSQYQCLKADNGADAFKLAALHQPSLIMTDVMMPGMTGIELTKMLKHDFQTCHIPVVMLTAKSGTDDQLLGIETGAEAYITKPFRNDHLRAVIQNLLTQRTNVVRKFTHLQPANSQPKQIDLHINSKDEEFLNNLTSFIETNYEKDLVIDQLAEHCCLSRTVFYTKLKTLTGLSPVEFVREFKLRIAVTLLEKGYNVSEVAFKIGFNDVKYFSRQFKALYGHPPSQHQKDVL